MKRRNSKAAVRGFTPRVEVLEERFVLSSDSCNCLGPDYEPPSPEAQNMPLPPVDFVPPQGTWDGATYQEYLESLRTYVLAEGMAVTAEQADYLAASGMYALRNNFQVREHGIIPFQTPEARMASGEPTAEESELRDYSATSPANSAVGPAQSAGNLSDLTSSSESSGLAVHPAHGVELLIMEDVEASAPVVAPDVESSDRVKVGSANFSGNSTGAGTPAESPFQSLSLNLDVVSSIEADGIDLSVEIDPPLADPFGV